MIYIKDMVADTCEKLQDFDGMEATMQNPSNKRVILGQEVSWEKKSLCAGLPGISMAFSQLLTKDESREDLVQAANRYLGKAVELFNQEGILDFGLHNGLAGLGLGITSLARITGGYQNVLSTINGALVDYAPQLIRFVQEKAIVGYDVISGAVGIVNYLFWHMEDDKVAETVQNLIDALIHMCEPLEDGTVKYGWVVPPMYMFSDEEREKYPHGAFNSGYAHGIAGVLGLFAKAYLSGICIPGQREAMERIIDYYMVYRFEEHGRYIWKGQMGLDEYFSIKSGKTEPGNGDFFRRDAWCYGAPGICYGLLLASEALGDCELRKMAMENMKSSLQIRDAIYAPTFCHGYAGLLQLAKVAERQAGEEFLREEKTELERLITIAYHPDAPFGFMDREYDTLSGTLRDYHEPGLLCGSTGIILALLDDGCQESVYQSAFGL